MPSQLLGQIRSALLDKEQDRNGVSTASIVAACVEDALGDSKTCSEDRATFAAELRDILLSEAFAEGVPDGIEFDLLPTLCRHAGRDDRDGSLLAIVQYVAEHGRARDAVLVLGEQLSAALATLPDSQADADEDEEDGQSPQAAQVLDIASRLLKPLVSALGRLPARQQLANVRDIARLLLRICRLASLAAPHQAGATDRRVEQILWSSVEFGEITLRASGCGGATSSVPDAHWILGRFITAVFGSLVLGLPLQSLPDEPEPAAEAYLKHAVALKAQLQSIGLDTACLLRWARQQQFADDFPGHPWYARDLAEDGGLDLLGCGVAVSVPLMAGDVSAFPAVWNPAHAFWLVAPYVRPMLISDRRSIHGAVKAVALLRFVVDSVQDGSLEYHDNEDQDDDVNIIQKIDEGSVSSLHLVQDLVSFASQCSQASVRMALGRLVRDVVSRFDVASQFRMLLPLVSECPYGSAAELLLDIVKARIVEAADACTEENPFWSAQARRFLPLALRLHSDTELEAKYDAIMEGLNILRFILLRDMGANKTGVWDDVGATDYYLLAPLEAAVDRCHAENPDPVARLRLDLLRMRIADVRETLDAGAD